jgi:hypothetical protein
MGDALPTTERGSSELVLLGRMSEQLRSIEAQLAKPGEDKTSAAMFVLEVFKVALGGWPVLGLVFLILFYVPIRAALNAIPEKVRTADEIGLPGGLSLKSSIKAEATRSGLRSLAETLPELSPAAIEMLLGAQRSTGEPGLQLVSWSGEDQTTTAYFPGEQVFNTLQELQSKGLVSVQSGYPPQPLAKGIAAAKAAIAEYKHKHPGKPVPTDKDRNAWQFTNPPKGNPAQWAQLSIYWELTDVGRQAYDVIVRAVATSLAPAVAAGKQ